MKLIFEALDDNKVAVREGVGGILDILAVSVVATFGMYVGYRSLKNKITNNRMHENAKKSVQEYLNTNPKPNYKFDKSDKDRLNFFDILPKYDLWSIKDLTIYSDKLFNKKDTTDFIDKCNKEYSIGEDSYYFKEQFEYLNSNSCKVFYIYDYCSFICTIDTEKGVLKFYDNQIEEVTVFTIEQFVATYVNQIYTLLVRMNKI